MQSLIKCHRVRKSRNPEGGFYCSACPKFIILHADIFISRHLFL